jgi:hypothetical protein
MPRNIIPIIVKKQESDNWCYASVIQALVRYYSNTNITQNTIASTYNCRYGMQDPVEYLSYHGYIIPTNKNNLLYGYKGIVPWNILINEINSGRPIISYVGKHYVLLVGYDGKSSRDTNRKYIFIDPLIPSELIEVPYDTLKYSGFLTNYEHTGIPSFESVKGYYLTQQPSH